MVKAGHIAVMVYLSDGESMPEGRSQIQHAQHVVKERFMQANVLFALDRLVHGVVRAITGIIRSIGSILPIPGMNNLMGFVRAFLRRSEEHTSELQSRGHLVCRLLLE